LWTERGFETGVEQTTTKEIAEAAGVTKGTFYFHFAHKEHILLEMGWATAQVLHDQTVRALADGCSLDETVDMVMTSLARRVTAAPRPAVERAVIEFNKLRPTDRLLSSDVVGERRVYFHDSFTAIFEQAQANGEIPASNEAEELGAMLEALVMDAILRWARGGSAPLHKVFAQRSATLLAGVRARGDGLAHLTGDQRPTRLAAT
jgi:AcrR family transcriptional regulator